MNDLCSKLVRGGGTCQLNAGHRGYHSTVVFTCDGCNRRRRGKPFKTAPDGEIEDGIQYCFTCVRNNRWRF